MGILDAVFRKEPPMENEEPEFKQIKKYRLCSEDNPNKRNYRCGKKDVCSPDCKLSLSLEELTSKDLHEIELEIKELLERRGFLLR